MHRQVWSHPHGLGCIGGPLHHEVEGDYRATVCGGCGVPVAVSYPAAPDDAVVPEPFLHFIAKQIERVTPH